MLDLTGVLGVLRNWRASRDHQRQGTEAHRRMLDKAERIQGGERFHLVPIEDVKTMIRKRWASVCASSKSRGPSVKGRCVVAARRLRDVLFRVVHLLLPRWRWREADGGCADLVNGASALLDELEHGGQPIIVTRRGQLIAVLSAIDAEGFYDYVLVRALEFVRGRREVDDAVARGELGVPLADVLAELDAEARGDRRSA